MAHDKADDATTPFARQQDVRQYGRGDDPIWNLSSDWKQRVQ
jgi:hypothetical protein